MHGLTLAVVLFLLVEAVAGEILPGRDEGAETERHSHMWSVRLHLALAGMLGVPTALLQLSMRDPRHDAAAFLLYVGGIALLLIRIRTSRPKRVLETAAAPPEAAEAHV